MSQVKLVDGGFSTQLVKHVGPIVDGDPLWTARFLCTEKDKCILVHRDFIKAGANIIITASYQSSIDGYKAHLGLNKEEAIAAIKESVILAKRAIELEEREAGTKLEVSVAGSVGPYGAMLHDGSEYTGNYASHVTKEELMNWHRPRIEALLEAGADLLAFETIPCSMEAFALVSLLTRYPRARAWLSFSIKDESKISSGESFKETAEKCWSEANGQLVAIGVNCLHPSLVTPVLQELKISSPHIPLVAYPNSGEKYDVKLGKWVSQDSKSAVTDYADEWLKLGISYLGGCCRTSDDDICQFSQEIKQWRTEPK